MIRQCHGRLGYLNERRTTNDERDQPLSQKVTRVFLCFRDFVVDPRSQLSVARDCTKVGMIADVLESPLPANQVAFYEKNTG